MKIMDSKIRKEKGYRTERQWNLAGRKINIGANPEVRWTNGFCNMYAAYFLPEQTSEMTEEEKRNFRECENAVKKARAEKRREQKELEMRRWEELSKWRTACQWLSDGYVPKDDANWRLGGALNPSKNAGSPLAENYYYCHEKDVVFDLQKSVELEITFDEHFLKHPNDWYDGSAWWLGKPDTSPW